MKRKWDHEVVNNQEDEDGFSLNPGGLFNYDSAKGKQDFNSNRDSEKTEPGSTKIAMVAPGTKRRISQLSFSSSGSLQSQ